MSSTMAPSLLIFICAGLGVCSHRFYFIHGEHILAAPTLLSITLAAPWCLGVAFYVCGIDRPFLLALVAYTSYLLALSSSILVYRVCFHQLHRIPGPFWARFSKLWYVYKIRHLDSFRFLDSLHAKYGPIVRTGPNEVSVALPEIVDIVHGPRSNFSKTVWYDATGHPHRALLQMRDRAVHDRRRREAWDKAFSARSLRSYEARVAAYANELVAQLSSYRGQAVDASLWMNWYSYDVMGDLAFGRPFNTLSSRKSHFAIDIIHESNKLGLGLLGPIPWALRILVAAVPTSLSPISRLIQFSEECIEERKKMKVDVPDVVHYFLNAPRFHEDPVYEHNLLVGESRLLIVAGSDTTAAALTCVLFYLARDPSLVQRLRTEIDQHEISKDFNPTALQNLHLLNAVINETLRLNPPVPSGVFRDSPSEGLKLGHFIPGGVTILTPIYTIQRSPGAFVDPEVFIPERWTDRPDLILNKSAFFPFLTGGYACIGKQLALMELRTVVAKLVMTFDISLAPTERKRDLLDGSLDAFVIIIDKLGICFQPRT